MVLLLAFGAAGMMLGQETFEVASVRPNLLNDKIVTIQVGPGGRFTARGYTLVLLMQRAYGVMDWNVTGGPDWIREDRFDVVATGGGGVDLTESRLRPMLQRLLAERFGLRVHRTEREMAGYALVLAGGGKTGSGLRPATDSNEERRDDFRMSANALTGHAISMPTFARFVGGKLGIVAIDETGLAGLYDFDVRWQFDPTRPVTRAPGDDLERPWRDAALDAIRAQLGLKMVAKKISVETIVIDRAVRAVAGDN